MALPLRVLEEVLEYRLRAHPLLASSTLLPFKIVLIAVVLFAPLYSPLALSVASPVLASLALIALGLKTSAIYSMASTIFVSVTGVILAVILDGDPERAFRFGLSAGSSLAIALFIAATTKPRLFKSYPALYIALISIDSVLREVLDTYMVLLSRGQEGVELYSRIVIDALLRGFRRSETLVDSLRSRGVDVD